MDIGSDVVAVNARERFLETAHFGKPDWVPIGGGGPRKATLERWWKEGMPTDVSPSDYFKFDKAEGISSYPGAGIEWHPENLRSVNLGPIPSFDMKILEQTDRYRVWTDHLGIKQRGFRADWDDGWSGFATREFLEFPVKNREDFLKVKKRYDPKSPGRYPQEWESLKRDLRDRDYPLGISLRGPFWWTREMMGLHAMLKGFYYDPDLIHEIMDFCAEFQIEALHRALNEIDPPPDSATISEDMAYKWGPMISPKMVREFMLSPYRRATGFLRDHNVDIIIVDSDGNIEPLIPVWLEAGINGVSPCEVAAGMDPVALRRRYPHLIIMGGIDKRELARDKKAIEKEVMAKVPCLIKTGGYFPGVDHGVPADVPLENFQFFLKLTRKLCGRPNTT
jgi:uroporphyrinogen-III decarboxylase